MHGYINRASESALKKALNQAPVVAILGARQCGKSTLARTYLSSQRVPNIFLDLQDRSDRNKLNEPELFFERHRDTLVCLDEIQLAPDLFSVLRVEIDKHRRPGRFLILGSASRDLLRQSTETLAGRIAFLELTPFLLSEVANVVSWQDAWQRGGFPESLLATDENSSYDWRENFIRTFLERDIPQLGFAIPSKIMERLWRLLAHYHGQTLNYSKTAAAADLSVPTFRKYLSILEQTYMLRLLPPSETNIKKRLIQSPKLYIRDSGLFHALRDIESFDDLMAHPANGASWEGFVIENLISANPRWQASYVRTSNAAEVDLILVRGRRRILIECKLTKAPVPSRGFHQLVSDLKPDAVWLAAPVDAPYEYQRNIRVGHLRDIRLNE
jgi:hypothetical protein